MLRKDTAWRRRREKGQLLDFGWVEFEAVKKIDVIKLSLNRSSVWRHVREWKLPTSPKNEETLPHRLAFPEDFRWLLRKLRAQRLLPTARLPDISTTIRYKVRISTQNQTQQLTWNFLISPWMSSSQLATYNSCTSRPHTGYTYSAPHQQPVQSVSLINNSYSGLNNTISG